MKQKLLIIGALLLLVANVEAQRIGIKGGISLSNADVVFADLARTTDNITGMQVGIIGEAKLFPAIYVNSGLLFTQKGFSNNVTTPIASGHIRINYLEVPLNLEFKVDVGPVALFAQAGPYVAYGINAKNVFEDSSMEPVKIEFGDNIYDLKRLDYGASIGAGVEMSVLQIGANYSFGMDNISNIEAIEITNGVFGIWAAILF